jgi:predicted Zn-dependent peptidase
MRIVFQQINESGVTADELDEAFNKVASRIVLRSERPMGRLSVVGGDWVYREQYQSVEEEIEAYRRVTLGDIRSLLDQYPLGMTTITELKPEVGAGDSSDESV